MNDRRVLVVGGGITGLAAAAALIDEPGLEVELWEAGARLGGKIATSPFAGLDRVDEGADAYLCRVPSAVGLARKVGLGGDEITAPTRATAMVWHGAMHDIPGGMVLGVPASIRPFATTRLLSWKGKARAALEPVLPRTDPDDSLGALVRARFGDEVHDRLVDSLVGSIYATDTDRFSLAAVPQIAALAGRNRSLLVGARRMRRETPPADPSSPIFNAPRRGMAALVDATARYATEHGARIDSDRAASTIERDGGRWRVADELFDAVIVASPARQSAKLLTATAPEVAADMATFEQADVTMVRLAVAADALPSNLRSGHSGYLVPKSQQRFVTAVSFGSQKWAHWQPPDGSQVLRVSLGRDGLAVADLGDDEVMSAVERELAAHLGVALQPNAVSITRWVGAFPQYRPHHADRVAALERALPGGIHVAGASYRGIGIPACIADGERAARQVVERLRR